MKLNKIIQLSSIVLAIIIMLFSCTTKDGDWDDNIELSQKEVNFDAPADSITITTKGEGWWISDIRLNDDHIDIDSVNTTLYEFDIIEAEFILSRLSSTEMQINLTENPNLEQRELIIGLQSGNYFDNLKVIQQGI